MVGLDVVLGLTIALTSLVMLAGLDMLGGTWRRRRRWHRRRRAEQEVMAAVVDALAVPARLPNAITVMRAADPAVAETVCLAAGRVVAEDDRGVLAALARAADVNRRARVHLRSSRWWRRLRAVRLLHLASDDPADLRVLNDPHPEVRAAALLWLSDRPGQLVRQPDSGRARRSASRDAGGLLAEALVSDAALVRIAAKHVCVKADIAPVWVLEHALEQARRPGAHPLAPVAPLSTVAALGDRVRLPLDDFLYARAAPVRAAAVRAIAATAPDRTAELVRRHVGDAQVVRLAVADIAGRDPAASPVLLDLADDAAWQVRQVARRSLLRSGAVGRALLRRLQQAVV
ncbi:hypothetical protein [Egicoccus sp. AB-alg6-2]|uniref:hypothetical protein n=1 Tax=Egicoccus sp. AB-alg6-2 TaxID=3242692 RepID=UPI00359D217D